MKKGFTLIEMLSVIIIIALLSLIVLPQILNQVGNQKEKVSDITKNIIYSSAELYLDENISIDPKRTNQTICITLEELVKNEKLEKPLTDYKTGKQIPLNSGVKVSLNDYNERVYELVDNQECKMY